MEFHPILLTIHGILFLFIYWISKKSIPLGILSVTIWFVFSLWVVNNQPSVWLDRLSTRRLSTHDEVIMNLDRCSPKFPLVACRILYNKPIIVINTSIGLFIEQFSSENLFAWLPSSAIIKKLLTFLSYLGIIGLLMSGISTKRNRIFMMWCVLYGLFGLFGGYNAQLSKQGLYLFLFLGVFGTNTIYEFFQK